MSEGSVTNGQDGKEILRMLVYNKDEAFAGEM